MNCYNCGELIEIAVDAEGHFCSANCEAKYRVSLEKTKDE